MCSVCAVLVTAEQAALSWNTQFGQFQGSAGDAVLLKATMQWAYTDDGNGYMGSCFSVVHFGSFWWEGGCILVEL